jgi:glycosyltransferase involved in cell wall biosynthesis
MIPTYNCAQYLRQTLQSVLAQDPGPEKMQIEVIDDCSTKDDPERVVREIGDGRIQFFRQAAHAGSVKNFNTCLEKSRGFLVHILHGDDFVEPYYYKFIEDLVSDYPSVGLYATRCFYVDECGVLSAISDRVAELEKSGTDIHSFLYKTPIQFAGVTVRRSSYESLGGFRADLVSVNDCEMWARIISARGGVVSNKVCAYYRIFGENNGAKLARTGESAMDIARLANIFAAAYPSFSRKKGLARASQVARTNYRIYLAAGDRGAAEANLRVWRRLTPHSRRFLQWLRDRAHTVWRLLAPSLWGHQHGFTTARYPGKMG